MTAAERAGYPIGDPRGDGEVPRGAPADPVSVRADDALLDSLPDVGGTSRLARVLVAWRRDVHTDPVGELVDTDTALAVIRAARTPRTHIGRLLRRVAAALRREATR